MSRPIIVERLEDVEVDVLELRDRLFPGAKGCTWRARQWSALFIEWSGQFANGVKTPSSEAAFLQCWEK